MREFRAPQHLFVRFREATEEQKMEIRKEVVEWMKTIVAAPGDRLIAPNPSTGEPEVFVKGGQRQ